MFSRQKSHIDIKKSTQKLFDSKKDNASKLKHLKLILENVDNCEAKSLFSAHYSHIYHLVYEGILAAESIIKQRGGFSQALSDSLPFSLVHKAQREELESALQLFEKILILLPDLLQCRWQLHSISRLMAKLNHPGNSIRMRREGIRFFIIWYQCLGNDAPPSVHSMFASLIPIIGKSPNWLYEISEDTSVAPLEITPILPMNPGERKPDDTSSYFTECLLDYMVSQAPKIHWNEGSQMWSKSIDFVYERFKEHYLPRIFGSEFSVKTNIYKPNPDLPELRKSADMSNNPIFNCQVVFIKWLANYAHSVYKPSDLQQMGLGNNPSSSTFQHYEDSNKNQSTPPSSISGGDRDSITSFSSANNDVDANILAKDVLLGSRVNINLLHEVFRRALLLNFVHSHAIRRIICVYKDWIQINVPELPIFMLEPDSLPEDEETDENDQNASSLELPPKNRLRTDSYYGAIGLNNNRGEYLRAGAQKILRIFFCNSAAVFLLYQIPKHEAALVLLEEQVDICKRVLNIYRYAVMNTRMDNKTWEQLLVVLLHIASRVLDQNQPHAGSKYTDTLGYKLASALFQTLIVSWVKASLNVYISIELWDYLHNVLSELNVCDDLITEWAKTMETLTRVLSRHVYGLDLTNLPLDRLSEQKAKKRRAGKSETFSKDTFKRVTESHQTAIAGQVYPRIRHDSSERTHSDRKSMVFAPSTPLLHKKLGLKRSMSEGNITFLIQTQNKREKKLEDFQEKFYKRRRKKSRSMDSIIKLPQAILNSLGQMHSDWAELSSSTASLENVPTIQMDSEINNSDVYEKGESKGVIAGGQIKGWLPSVAAILWRRMLGALGNVNQFKNPKTHYHFFQVLTEIWGTLTKIRANQGVSLDNTSTPEPPELVPPLTLIVPWCLEAFDLPSEFDKGKMLAISLLSEIILTNQDLDLNHDYLCRFYALIHRIIISKQQGFINEIVKRLGLKFISKMIPGFSMLLMDLLQATHIVLSSDDLKRASRNEAATLLGSLLAISDVSRDEGVCLPILKPSSKQFQPVPNHQTRDIAFSCLLQFAKIEKTAHARSIILQSLTIFLCKDLMEIRFKGFPLNQQNLSPAYASLSDRINQIIILLLSSVKVDNRSIALVSSDLLLVLAEFSKEISTYFPNLCFQIIMGLNLSIKQILPSKNSSWGSGRPIEIEKRLILSLMLTLGEWCMNIPLEMLIANEENQNGCIISSVFEVLLWASQGYHSDLNVGDKSKSNNNIPTLEHFDPCIPFDDLQTVENIRSQGKDTLFMRPNNSTNESNSIVQEVNCIRLAARNLVLHLMTQVNHFPLNGSAKCGSLISENDDLLGYQSEFDELNPYIFSLPNLQMFTLEDEILLSILELSTPKEYSGVKSELQSTSTQVRIIVRDLSGKACWDASNLYSTTVNIQQNKKPEKNNLIPRNIDESFYHSVMTGNFIQQMGTRLTQIRKRPRDLLPTFENTADDYDNLDDLLQYIGHTSPECLLRIGEPLNSSWTPPSSLKQEQEDEVVSFIVNQRTTETEYLLKFDLDPTMRAKPIDVSPIEEEKYDEMSLSEIEDGNSSMTGASLNSKGPSFTTSFLLSRRLFNHLGLGGWDKRSKVDLLNKDEKLLRELKHLDSQKCREAHKIAVMYVAEGQEDKQSILLNTGGSEDYEEFVAGLGWEVELETHTGFIGGLQKNKSSGDTAPYYATSFSEVIFHVATRMPSKTEESLLQKTRHLGNDVVHIVWSEHTREYRRDIIPTEFCDVLIVIYPIKFGLFRIQISRKPEVPYFGPLYNEAIVGKDILSILIRQTAINASRAGRSSLQFYQHYFEERAKSLSTIIQNHKMKTTFEQFSSSVFSPLLPVTNFNTGTVNRASGTNFTASRTSSIALTTHQQHQLASALLDSSFSSGSSRRGTVAVSGMGDTSEFRLITSSPGSSSSVPQSPIPPVPPKRLSLKLGGVSQKQKPKLQTPPASPSATGRQRTQSGNLKIQ